MKKLGPRTSWEVMLEHESSIYVDSMLKVVFPIGNLEIEMPNKDAYTGV